MQVSTLVNLHDQGRMTWTEQEHGWVAIPEDVLDALARGGSHECKREMTTSRRDLRPAGGVWQGVARSRVRSPRRSGWPAPPSAWRSSSSRSMARLSTRTHATGRGAAELSYKDEGGES